MDKTIILTKFKDFPNTTRTWLRTVTVRAQQMRQLPILIRVRRKKFTRAQRKERLRRQEQFWRMIANWLFMAACGLMVVWVWRI